MLHCYISSLHLIISLTFVLERKNTFFSLFCKTSVWDPLIKFFEREGSKSDSVISGGRVAKKKTVMKIRNWVLLLVYSVSLKIKVDVLEFMAWE